MSPHPNLSHAVNDQLITNPQQLTAFLLRGARPKSEWGVGLETEKLVVDRHTGEAVSYERIRELLDRLDGIGGWQGVYEQEKLIGLQGKRSSVTLEPGGQLELSGKFCCDITCSWRDLNRYRQHIVTMGHELDLVFLGLGVHPFSSLDEITWLPKPRYGIMAPYMLKSGDMGQRMMKQTAGTQVNLDFSDEEDCVRKLRVAQWLSPVCYALFANSAILEGQPSQSLSFRGEIWSRTDPDRCGLIESLFQTDAGFDDFVAYALDVPLYFIERQQQLIDLTQQRFTFRQFLEEGWNGEQATLHDWNSHLSTLFSEVRLRPQIEVRSADSLPPRYTAAVAAFYKGLLYTEQGLSAVESLFSDLDLDDFRLLYQSSWRHGLKTRIKDGTLQEVATELLRVAVISLQEQFQNGDSGADESHFLRDISEVAASGETLAERLLKRWHGNRQDKLQLLFEHCGYDQSIF
ncbi:glutamate-cysteine ligase family protein [uncultured Desulfuromusa sp.]|uniref:glutamate--cysteine ligase n=1 Tax=uncultured Desulfuromusa sp. TaxID=219183 RepID=UPI002AA64373|nr:glutamate-cysteine ligase family protein [uncultured Desulfuromusa sp.]